VLVQDLTEFPGRLFSERSSIMWDFPLFPVQASSLAVEVDSVFVALFAFGLFFSFAICFLIIFFAIKYRRGSKADRTPTKRSTAILEVTWIVIPFFIVLGLFVWATLIFAKQFTPPRDAFEVFVLGRQWMWELRHPEGKREINELHVPLGRAVRLTMISEDVIHSFYIPAFRIKQDVLPGRYTSLWFRPTRVGTFHLFCAEYCGMRHAGMIGSVVVMDPAEYERWLEGETAAEGSLAEQGGRLFRRLGCSGCHSANATVRAPLLDGVYGRPVPLQSGEVVMADPRYIRDSILLPKSQVAAGYEPVMPTFEWLTESDLLQLIAYIKSLGESPRGER
jgi:cytochrome c oxidase subunit 2